MPSTSGMIDELTDHLVDVALGKVASQSSVSQWSRINEANDAVSGVAHSDFAFHTDEEDRPWWSVDLGATFPIEKIVVHNRVGMLQERAARLRVELGESQDGPWTLIHAGYTRFGGGGNGQPLTLEIRSDLRGRHVRLSLDDRQSLHLSRVQVFVKPEIVALATFCARTGLPFHSPGSGAPYTLTSHPSSQINEIVGIKIDYSGRFGNLLIQYINVIQLAERTGLKYVQLGRHELFDVTSSFTVNGIQFFPAGEELPPVGLFLAGEVFNSDPFVPVLSPFLRYGPEEEKDTSRICQTYVIPHILTGLPVAGEQKFGDELTIHLRAGDIFDCDHPVTYGYRQPPLSFYRLVVGRMRAADRISRVRLVYEDRGNPCIAALEDWLTAEGIPFRNQCVSLRDDMSALVDADHLVFGHGTFGYAACRLSRSVKTVHFFAPQLGGSYECMPNVGEVYEVADGEKNYIKAFEYGKPFESNDGWRRTPEMYKKMLTYPLSSLRIRRAR